MRHCGTCIGWKSKDDIIGDCLILEGKKNLGRMCGCNNGMPVQVADIVAEMAAKKVLDKLEADKKKAAKPKATKKVKSGE